jgi:hypothetical protein
MVSAFDVTGPKANSLVLSLQHADESLNVRNSGGSQNASEPAIRKPTWLKTYEGYVGPCRE